MFSSACLHCGGRVALDVPESALTPRGGTGSTADSHAGSNTLRTSAGGTTSANDTATQTAPGGSVASQCPDELVTEVESMSLHGNLVDTGDRYTPSCRALPGTSDLVVAFSAPEAGTYIVDTLGSGIDTVLAVYDGLCGTTELACNDEDEHLSHQSRLVLELETAQMVTIVVDGYRGQSGNVLLNVSPPRNLIDMVVSAVGSVTTTGNTKGLRDRLTSSCNSKLSSSDYVYSFESQRSGTYAFSVRSGEFKPILSLRDGGPAGKEIACNGDLGAPRVSYALQAGRTVAVVVDGYDGSSGEFQLSIEPDPSDSGSCAVASSTRIGCIDPDVTSCVCEQIAECCLGPWKALCALSDPSLACGAGH